MGLPEARRDEGLAGLLRDALGARRLRTRGELAVVAVPAPLHPVEAVVAGARGDAFALVPPEGPVFVGAGEGARIEATGQSRLASLRAQARALLWRVSTTSSDPLLQPRLFGGFAFADHGASSHPWSAFGAASFVLPRWTYVRQAQRAWLVVVSAGGDESVVEEIATAMRSAATWQSPEVDLLSASLAPEPDADWIDGVTAASRHIADGGAEKVVLVRRRTIPLDAPIAPDAVLAALRREPRATRFWFRRDGVSFVGATPELLVSKRGARVETEALAGTAAGHLPPEELLASDKDRREQELVVSAITERLRRVCHGVAWPREPRPHRLADLWHLRTPIEAMVAPDSHVLDLASALHPTPAVGGTPREAALDWLAAHERIDRGWYTGAIGWLDADGDGALWVALRAALVRDREALVYAGAGIVTGSEPEAELRETDLKMRRVLRALAGGA